MQSDSPARTSQSIGMMLAAWLDDESIGWTYAFTQCGLRFEIIVRLLEQNARIP